MHNCVGGWHFAHCFHPIDLILVTLQFLSCKERKTQNSSSSGGDAFVCQIKDLQDKDETVTMSKLVASQRATPRKSAHFECQAFPDKAANAGSPAARHLKLATSIF